VKGEGDWYSFNNKTDRTFIYRFAPLYLFVRELEIL
jgi:hypothetical protein